MLRLGIFLCWVLLASVAGMSGATADDGVAALYQAKAIVTGTGEVNRQIGFGLCLEQVLVKVSGDQHVLSAPALPPLLSKAGTFVSSFHYHDRMAGIPIHDEQGTHDRPQDLACIYKPETIDALLDSLDLKPWLGKRPRLVIFLSVRHGEKTFLLTNTGKQGFYMRDSFHAAAVPLAMSILFPDAAAIRAAHIDADNLRRAGLAALDALAAANGGDRALAGTIVWSDKDLGWIAEWRLDSPSGMAIWRVKGVSFDEAFRNAIRGAAQLLSGHGAPD